MIVAAVQVL